MKLTFLGGAGEVGRSGVLIDQGYRLLMDYGIKLHDKTTQYPLRVKGGLDAVIITHSHLDHCGFLPAIYDHYACPWFGTYPTQILTDLLIRDSIKIQKKVPFRVSSFKRSTKHFTPMEYGAEYETEGMSFTLHNAGHITGSSMVEVKTGETSLLYTGDFKLKDIRMQKGADVPKCDILVTETTYSQREHPPRDELEKRLSQHIRDTLENGGNVLLPSFAIGRSQELLQILYNTNRDATVYLDGMAKTACELVRQCPSFVSNFNEYEKALNWVQWVDSREKRADALKSPSVIITTAGMLEGGPVFQYLLNLNKRSRIVLTGYCVDNTNGWHLMNEGFVYVNGRPKKIDTPLEYLDFSAHAGRSEIFELVDLVDPKKIFCVHGDHTAYFADELKQRGYDAYAPKIGEEIVVV
ncbi:MAG: MBL fold metallo-hydrolase [Candidatus Micrarchaeota archaeon]